MNSKKLFWKYIIPALFLNLLFAGQTFVEDPKLILDKPGSFKVVIWSVYNSMSGSNFTKTDKDANYKKLVTITDTVRKNPVLSNIKGFDCQALLYARNYDIRNSYGIPCQLSFEFCSWLLYKGKEVKETSEPPHWDIEINVLNPFTRNILGGSTFKPSEKPKAGFNYEAWNKVGEKLRDMLQMPGKKETLEPGMDRYNNESVIIYNPDRPPYWLPVTIREAFTLLIELWRLHPDQVQSDFIAKTLEDEYAHFSEEERNGYAYAGSGDERSPIGNIGTQKSEDALPVMRVNPAYWNKSLPRSAVQILTFNCPADKNFIRKEKEERLKYNSTSYHVSRFVESLDIRLLLPLIDR
ncbi:MAG: hypothetical protein WBW16_05885 [Bacteroidota bacterium]